MSELLKVSRTLQLPLSAVTSTFGLLAVRGAGKSNAGRALAEEMFKANLPFCAIDPVGSWYGLRAGRDGKPRGGLPVFIFGGEHGDVEITRGSGVVVADTVVSQRLASIIDLSGFDHEHDKQLFLLDFARRLYQKNKSPLHLFLEEADDYIPQQTRRGMSDDLKRAWETIVRRGRGRGLGMTLITQRSAVVNKDVLTQVETLFVLRTTGPQDLKQVEAWVKHHSVDSSMLESLASLEDGEAWVWSPHFLKKFERFRFRESHTFDSGATPKNFKGKAAYKVATLRDVNVKLLKGKIAETLQKSDEENPAVLRSRIAQLKAEVHNLQVEIERMQKKQPRSVNLAKLEKLVARFHADAEKLASASKGIAHIGGSISAELDRLRNEVHGASLPASPAPAMKSPSKGGGVSTLIPPPAAKRPLSTNGEYKLDACARALLQALAQKHPKAVSDRYLAIVSGYSLKSSGFKNAMSTLRTTGMATGGRSAMVATEQGVSAAGDPGPLPTGKQLVEHWMSKLDATPRLQLQVLAQTHPGSLTKDQIAVQTERSLSSSGFKNGLSTLRSLGLVVGSDPIKLSEEFFP